VKRLAMAGVPIAVALAVGLAGCGIPTGDASFSEIPNEDIPFGLEATTTTTTTTTTTMPVAPATTEMATTTSIQPLLEQVDVYFLARGRLVSMRNALTSGFAANQVVELLESGPPSGVGLDSLIDRGLIRSTEVAEGIMTVDLDPEVFARIESSDQAEAIGQIVLTMTDNVGRVGSVLFTLGGEPTQVKKGDSLLSEPGEAVTFDDYAILLASTPLTTTTTTTVPVESVPDSVAPDDATPAGPLAD
jgi:hypothetical protein